jgi:protein-tyrosine kinase
MNTLHAKNTVSFVTDELKVLGLSSDSSKCHQLSSISEEFRAIKREVLTHAFPSANNEDVNNNKNRIMITSIGEKEGKTFVAVNLARSIALEQNKYVLLVDANVLAPKISSLVSPQPTCGLIDFLSDPEVSAAEAIYTTDIERLTILPVGKNHYLANELLYSESMLALMEQFKNRYNDRLVIFDAPPLLGVNETLALSKSVDQIIVVVEDDKVNTDDFKNTILLLPDSAIVHFVLNKTLKEHQWKK